MAEGVRVVPSSIGWVDLLWVINNHLQYAAIKNLDGEFVSATPESVAAAGASALPFFQTRAPDFRLFVTNGPGKNVYPVSSFMWLLIYDDTDKKQHSAMIDFLKWVLTDGQKLALKLGYPPLPSSLVEIELHRLGVEYSLSSR